MHLSKLMSLWWFNQQEYIAIHLEDRCYSHVVCLPDVKTLFSGLFYIATASDLKRNIRQEHFASSMVIAIINHPP